MGWGNSRLGRCPAGRVWLELVRRATTKTDSLSRLLTWIEDLREAPHHRRIELAMQRAQSDMQSAGFVIRSQAERIPERKFLCFPDETVTFGAYNARVNQYLRVITEAGVGRGDPIGIMMENSADFLMAQGACAKLGVIGALINTSLRGDALSHVLNASGARLVLADRECARALVADDRLAASADRHILALGGADCGVEDLDQALAAVDSTEVDIADVGLGDVFLYIYTSGTTGYPKPAVVRHARFTMGGVSLAATLGIEQGDCSYAPTPLYHGYSNFVGFSPALHGGTTFASRNRFSARHFLGDVRRVGATHFMYVGELCRYLLNQPPSEFDRAHSIRLATGPGLRPDIWRRFRERFGIDQIFETYGQTEANVSLMNRRGRVGSIGRAAPGTHDNLKLVRFDPDEQVPQRNQDGRLIECRVGQVGELVSVVSSKTRMRFDGYVNSADNEQKLIRDCFEVGDVYLRTGDLMRRDRAGYYYFVDRIGDTFRWKGENVSTAEVAELLNGAPKVLETAVYGVRVPGTEGRAGMALVVLEDDADFDPVGYYDFAARVLPPYARPLFVRLSRSMDTTGTLKHSKTRLQREGYDLSEVAESVFFRSDGDRRYLRLDPPLVARIVSGVERV